MSLVTRRNFLKRMVSAGFVAAVMYPPALRSDHAAPEVFGSVVYSNANGRRPPFRLEALVDFPDDALTTVITREHVNEMMLVLKGMGVRRVSWAYYGDGHGGYFIPSGLNQRWQNYADTLAALDNPLRIAAEAAHRNGMELYAYYKPYETGPALSLPEGSPDARAFGRVKQQGGWLSWLDPFVVEHPDLRIRHRQDDSIKDLSGKAVSAIRLIKKDDSPTRITREHLQIWASNLNYRYRQLDIDFTFNESIERSPKEVRDFNGALVTRKGDPVQVLTMSGINLTDPYILVTTDFTNGPGDFENAGTELLIALDAEGKEIPGVFATGSGIWEGDRVDFRTWGLLFDIGYGQSLVRLDEPSTPGRRGIIGFTRGRNEYLPAALCETEPLVRNYWLSCIREMIDAGVDGVDFRVENHSTHTDYSEEYGFNDIVLEECMRRGNTDTETIARVRGEAYTDFLRKSKMLIAARGKRMRVNLNIDWFRPDPPPARRLAYPGNIDFDWRRWVDEGLFDEGIMRMFAIPFDAIFNDSTAQEMIDRCRKKGIPLVVNRYIRKDYPQEFLRVREDNRFSGFILYETAAFLKFDDRGTCSLENDAVAEVSRLMKGEGP